MESQYNVQRKMKILARKRKKLKSIHPTRAIIFLFGLLLVIVVAMAFLQRIEAKNNIHTKKVESHSNKTTTKKPKEPNTKKHPKPHQTKKNSKATKSKKPPPRPQDGAYPLFDQLHRLLKQHADEKSTLHGLVQSGVSLNNAEKTEQTNLHSAQLDWINGQLLKHLLDLILDVIFGETNNLFSFSSNSTLEEFNSRADKNRLSRIQALNGNGPNNPLLLLSPNQYASKLSSSFTTAAEQDPPRYENLAPLLGEWWLNENQNPRTPPRYMFGSKNGNIPIKQWSSISAGCTAPLLRTYFPSSPPLSSPHHSSSSSLTVFDGAAFPLAEGRIVAVLQAEGGLVQEWNKQRKGFEDARRKEKAAKEKKREALKRKKREGRKRKQERNKKT